MTDTADEPRTVYLTATDGTTTERIDCLLEQIGPNHWQATPVRDIRPNEMLQVYIDKLPAGATVEIAFPPDD